MACEKCGSRCMSIRSETIVPINVPITTENFDSFLSVNGLRRWQIRSKLSACLKIAGEEYIIGYSTTTDRGDFIYSEEMTIICDDKSDDAKIYLYCHGNKNIFHIVKDFLSLTHHYFTISQLSKMEYKMQESVECQ